MTEATGTGLAWRATAEELLRPLGTATGLGAWLESEGRREWLLEPGDCPCRVSGEQAGEADSPPPKEATCQACCRAVQRLDLGEGQTVVLCAADPGLLALAAGLHEAARRIAVVEEERDGLCEELALAYESLASIYEVGTDPGLLLDSGRALDRILERLEAIRPGCRAIFWLLQDEQFVPLRWRGPVAPGPRPARGGLLGRCLAQQRGLIANIPAAGADAGDLETEFQAGGSVAIAPLRTRDQILGCLSVQDAAAGAFDSHLMGLLTALGNQAAMVLEHERLYRQKLEGERMRSELVIGARIQRSLLFGQVPRNLEYLEVGVVTAPSRHVDGDFYEFFPHSAGCLDLLVGDVMGKGLPAALVGAAVKSEFLRVSGAGYAGEAVLEPDFPARVVAMAHEKLGPGLAELGSFVTACYARFDLGGGRLLYVDCGHTSTLHYRAAGGRVVELDDDPDGRVNLPLGMDPSCRFHVATAPVAPGDVLLFYSDGVTEARNPAGEMYGSAALARFLREHVRLGAEELAEAVRAEVTSFAGSVGLSDDLTCVVVKVLDGRESCQDRTWHMEFPARRGQLHVVREFVAEVCRDIPVLATEVELYRMQLAVVEAVSNIVRHAYGEDEEGVVQIEAWLSARQLRFTLADHGGPFDPEVVPEPVFDGSRSGGFGVFLIREVMDDVRYLRGPDGTNQLILIKHLEPREQA